MFGQISGSYADLTDEQREMLATFLSDRNNYLMVLMELNRRRVTVLQSYTPDAEQALNEFSATFVAPVRAKLNLQSQHLYSEAVDVEKLMSMLPMVGMALMQAVNIPILMSVLGLDPDMVDEFVGQASQYFSKDM